MLMIKDYYELMKPGLVYGNLVPMVAGFALGSQWRFDFALLGSAAIGLALVMASGCVFNNYFDRDLDARMERTKARALVMGRISGWPALAYGAALGLAGFAVLGVFTNPAAFTAAGAGFFFYIFVYTLWLKRRTAHAALVGSIAGAAPPVVGYAAAAHRIDAAALVLFFMLALWQMPHFYAIGIRRLNEYAAAGIPILPVKRGIRFTKISMFVYIAAFTGTASLLVVFGYMDVVYLAVVLAFGMAWLAACLSGFRTAGPADDAAWARAMFFLSLAVMIAVSIAIFLHV